MKISYHTVKDNLDTTRGYGAAGFQVVTSLQRLGHEVLFDSPDAPVQISFCQPAWQKFHPGQYKISYVPWESTELPEGWVGFMNDCDEVWATSEWVAKVYRDNGVIKPIYVYEHGLDTKWAPIKREYDGGQVRFLHLGEPALRKGGQFAIDAFRQVFGDSDKVHLTMKAYYQHYLRGWKDGEHVVADRAYDNITLIDEMLHATELRKLYEDSHFLVYPSYGEGFGFIPLQALGTGMPVISTFEWAAYSKYINLPIHGRWDRSVWSVHPGNVLYPDFEELKVQYRNAAGDPQLYLDWAYENAPLVHADYNWEKKTADAWQHVFEKFS